MSNPWQTGNFVCCLCPDGETKYRHRCDCPFVNVECVSKQRTAILCGHSEFSDGGGILASVPPKKYLKQVEEATFTAKAWTCCPDGIKVLNEAKTVTPSRVTQTYTPPGTSPCEECEPNTSCDNIADFQSGEMIFTNFKPCGTEIVSETSHYINQLPTSDYEVTSQTSKSGSNPQEYFQTTGDCDFLPYKLSESEHKGRVELSEEDTDEAALLRAEESVGDSCSSVYELRTDSFQFQVSTVKYTVKATGLLRGITYEGCVHIQRREAYSGTLPASADTEWHDVKPDTLSGITATNNNTDEDGVTTVVEDVDLPGGTENSIGYAYRIVGAHIWPSYAECECPTDYQTEVE